MNPGNTPGDEFDQLAELYMSVAKTIDRLREANATEIDDKKDAELVGLARAMRDRADEYNTQAARVKLAAVKPALADLAKVKADVDKQLKVVRRVEQIAGIAQAAISLAAAVASGNLSSVGSALKDLAKVTVPIVSKAGAGGGGDGDSDA